MKHSVVRLLALLAVMPLSACTTMAINMMVPTIEKLSAVGFEKTDTDFVGTAMPASLLQLEGMLTLAPDNEKLNKIVAETKCGYAFGWVENMDKEKAAMYYLEGKDLALHGLYVSEKRYRKAIDAGKPINEAIDAIKDEDAAPLLFQVVNCWGNWLNLNKSDMSALFKVPALVAALNKLLVIDPNHFYGSVYMTYGSIYAAMPEMAGGGLERARVCFDKAFESSKNEFLLIHTMFAMTYTTALKDLSETDIFNPDKPFVRPELREKLTPEQYQRLLPCGQEAKPTPQAKTGAEMFDEMMEIIETTDAKIDPQLGLANTMAKEKAADFKGERDNYFFD